MCALKNQVTWPPECQGNMGNRGHNFLCMERGRLPRVYRQNKESFETYMMQLLMEAVNV